MKMKFSFKDDKNDSRTVNSLRNAATSLGGQALNNVLRFVCRTVFVYTLGKNYLGISTLYSSVLTLLSIAELGFGTAITYSLYKPLAEGDTEKIKSLMQYFKKAYRTIGFVIFGLGMCLMPFLPKLLTRIPNEINIYEYYLLYLLQTVVSYLFFAYKAVLLNADQKKYITDLIQYMVQVLMNVVQIIELFAVRSFFLYTVLAIVFAVVQNIATAAYVDRRYPYLKEKAQPLGKAEKKTIFTQVYATALYKVSAAIGTATDNLIISAYISTAMVGIYGNYFLIIQVFQNIIDGVVRAFSASVGNLFAVSSREKSEFTFRCLNLLNDFAVAFCAVEFMSIFQPFMTLWMGRTMLISNTVLIIVVYNFAANYMQLVVNIYNESTGTFVYGKYRAVATAVLNLIISIVLVKKMGLAGVFLGTIISRAITMFWFDPMILYKKAFQMPVHGYFLQYGITMAVITGCSALVYVAGMPFTSHPILCMIEKGILALVVTPAFYWLIYHRSEEYRFLMEKAKGMLKKRRVRHK
ncbi:MAG: MATE family efflux transporter [Lachnospiraceae bacterium]|nr:MATE family efflux transporter [Lachnospiraceae bacterium]